MLYAMEESSFPLILSVISPSHLMNILQHCHNINPSKMFLTIASIIILSSIFRFLNRRFQRLSCMNPRKMICSKKSSSYIVLQIRVWLCSFFSGLEMAIGACFGVSPFSFRRRKFSALMEEKEMHGELESKKTDTQVTRAKSNDEETSYNGASSSSSKEMKGSSERKLCALAEEFMVMTELRNKTLTLRDLLDLSPCIGSTSVHDLLILTLKDLHVLYPCVGQIQVSEIEKATMDQILNSFCNAMKSIGETWTGNDEWMIKSNDGSFNLEVKNLEHHALVMLEDMIKLASERMFDEDEEMVDSPNAFSRLLSEPCSPVTPTSVLPETFNVPSYRRMGGCCSTPIHTPLRVETARTLSPVDVRHLSYHMLPHLSDQDSKYTIQVTNTGNTLKKERDHDKMLDSPKVVIAKLEDGKEEEEKDDDNTNWIDGSIIKLVPTRIAVDVILHAPSLAKLQSYAPKQESPLALSLGGLELQTLNPISSFANSSSNLKLPQSPPPITQECVESLPSPLQKSVAPRDGISSLPPPPPPPPPPPQQSKAPLNGDMMVPPSPHPPPYSPQQSIEPSHNGVLPPPPPPPPPYPSHTFLAPINNGVIPSPPSPSLLALGNIATTPPPPPPPLPMRQRSMVSCSPPIESNIVESTKTHLPPPPPQPPKISSNLPSFPPPPPFPMRSQGITPPPHPPTASNAPPVPIGKGVSCPPPPSFDAKNIRTKKGSKLKRSSQMGNLYRLLKVKVEGSNLDGKLARKGKLNSTSGGKQGMADALAEMTKRSTYFQQIEEDVKKHASAIKEMITAITNFQTSDMSELIKFHKYVESHLEKLTDESQVLARFEDFPTKKLEALRMAATLYSKLDAIASTLQQWPKASPVGQLLDKSESYISKIKGDLEKIEQTKDEEQKKYASHRISFDFSILVRIKEYMVDVSSNCMELALKEWRDSNAMEKEAAGGGKKGSSGKMLWKAFQFAYRIYTFAGGLDDRADKLTKELAHEIEKEPNP